MIATIYADYQATTPVDPRVLGRMEPHWRESFGNPHSSDHVIGWRAAETVREASASVSGLVGCDADEVIFTSGATEANNLALQGLARRAPAGRRRLLVSAIEHKCVLASARALAAHHGFTVDTIPVDREGFVDLAVLAEQLDDTVLVASIMAVNNETGAIQDIPRIAGLLAAHDILFHCDAAQAPCAMDVSGLAAHADLISLSGHKIYGPQGIGALCVRRDLHDRMEPMIHGGGQQEGLRSGTVPVPLCAGIAASAELLCAPEAAGERARLSRRRDRFLELLERAGCPVVLNGPAGRLRHAGNANLRFPGFDAHAILGALQPRLAASTGSACTSGAPEPSHVLRAMGLTAAEADASIRFSFGRFTTDDEVEEAARLVARALESLSGAEVAGGVGSQRGDAAADGLESHCEVEAAAGSGRDGDPAALRTRQADP